MNKQLFIIALLICFTISCSKNETSNQNYVFVPSSLLIDTALVPADTVLNIDTNLEVVNGVMYRNKLLYKGYVKTSYVTGVTSKIEGYYEGMLHGKSTEFYPNGALKTVRIYKANKAYGKHTSWWENGKLKFEFYYEDDKRVGSNKQWYEGGEPYAFMNFKDDKEEGLQQAWRRNGKIYINYEVRDGYRYGLQKSALCYTLRDEKLVKAD